MQPQIEKVAYFLICLFVCPSCAWKEVTVTKHPYMVYMNTVRGEFWGSGTVINKRFILTAGSHLRQVKMKRMEILLSNGDEIKIESIKYHEKFVRDSSDYENETEVSNDIALIKTQTDIPLDSASFIKLPSKDFNVASAATCVSDIIDWIRPPILHRILSKRPDIVERPLRVHRVATIYNHAMCRKMFKDRYDMATNFCVAPEYDELVKNCERFRGAPVICNNIQIGISLQSNDRCFLQTNNSTIIATMVSQYLDWIHKNSILTDSNDNEDKNIIQDTIVRKKSIRKKNNASSFRAFFLLKTLLFCITVGMFNL